jgi:hypothetical protein
MIENSKVHVCDACGHRAPGHHKDSDRPATLAGFIGPTTNQGIMGTVDVPTGDGETFETKPWYAHRTACIRKAIENIINELLPPLPEMAEHEQ